MNDTDAFAQLLGHGRGTGASDTREAPHHELIGGYPDGVLVVLRGVVDPAKKIQAIKALRTLTGKDLRWAKEVTDRAAGGERLIVSCSPREDVVSVLAEGYWDAQLAQPDGTRDVKVRIPDEAMQELREFLAEHGGAVLG